jgi:hypothetical protein
MKFGMDVKAIGICAIIILLDFLPPVIPAWWTNELVSWD